MAGKSKRNYSLSKGKYALSSSTPSTLEGMDKVQSQIDNAKTRLSSIGSDYDATDNRNWLEKTLNLEKDQNVLFDILEIINRPQNALLTGIDNALSGRSFGEGLKEGITGETKTTGKDLLMNHANMDDEEGKLDLVDVLGFGIDMVSDPLDWAILPAKGAGLAGDAAKALSKVDDATDALNTARKVGDATGIAKATNALTAAQTASNAAQDALTQASKSLFYNGGKTFTSAGNILGKTVGKGFKAGAGLADKAIEGTLGVIDSRNAKKIENIIGKSIEEATSSEIADAARQLNINPNKKGLYQDLKKGAKNLVNSSANVEGFVGRSRAYDAGQELDTAMGEKALQNIKNKAERIAKNSDYSVDELMQRGFNAVESNRNWDLTGQDIIKKFKENRNVDFITPEQASKVKDTLDQFGIKTRLDETGKMLNMDTSNLKKLYTIQDSVLDPTTGKALGDAMGDGTSFKDFVFGSKNSKEVNDLLRADREFFNQTPELQDLYNDMQGAVKNYATNTSDISRGLDAGEVATTDYGKHSRTDATRKIVSDKEFKSRQAELDASVAQVNKMQEEKRFTKLSKEEEALDRNLKSIYKTEIDADGNEVLLKDKAGNYIRDDNKYNQTLQRKEKLVNSINTNIQSSQEVQNFLKKGTYDATKLTEKGKKNIRSIELLVENEVKSNEITKAVSDYMNEIKGLKDITPDGIEALNELNKQTKEFSKFYTELKNTAPKVADKFAKGKGDEIGGLFTADEQMKQLFEKVTNAKDKLGEQLAITKAANNKEYINGIRSQLNSYKKGVDLGDKSAKAIKKVKDSTARVENIRSATADTIETLNKRLNYEKEALNNLRDAKDTFYEKTLESIKNHTEQIELLKSQEGQTFFKTKFDEAFTDYVRGAASQNASTKKFYDALANSLFDNDTYAKVAKDGEKVGWGYTKIKGNKLIEKFESYKPIMTDEAKEMGELLQKFADKDVIIDKQFATALDVASKTDKAQLNPLFRVWDGMNNVFKKFSTLTPGFHMRNIIGNSTDMVLSGVNPAQLPVYYKKAANIWNKADDLIEKASRGALNEAESKQFKILKQFYEGGFADAVTKGQGLEEVARKVNSQTKNPINKVAKWSIDANNKVDAYNRLALLLYANDNPTYLAKLGKKTPIDAVRHVLFDPDNLSDAEKSFKRVIPFYTFTKQNLMFQADNLMKNTGRYSKLYKAIRDGYNDLPEDSYQSFQRDNMQIPLPFLNDDGEQLFIKTNLPVSDLGEFLSNPIQRTLSSTSPVIKAPVEMVTGKSLFTGDDTRYNTLSKTLQDMGIDNTGITSSADAAELILNNFGLQNVSTNLVKKVKAVLDNAEGNISGQQLWSEIFRSVLQDTKQESVRNSGLYDELEKYQAEIKRLKNQGTEVPTIKELNANSKISLNKLKRKRARSK